MHILLTNDDGINAPGLAALHEALAGCAELFTVAPMDVCSGTSHAISITGPVAAEPVTFGAGADGMAVNGTPADCVELALHHLWPRRFGDSTRPDMTLCGINSGANVGHNILSSGTVAAATESALHGTPAMSLSLQLGQARNPSFEQAAAFLTIMLDRLSGLLDDQARILNINFPALSSPKDPLPGIVVAPVETSIPGVGFSEEVAPEKTLQYQLTGFGETYRTITPGSDVDCLHRGQITVTPLSIDRTDAASLGSIRKGLKEWTHFEQTP